MNHLTFQLKIITFFLSVLTLFTEFVLPIFIDHSFLQFLLPFPVLILFTFLLLYSSRSFDSIFLYSFQLLLFSAFILLTIYFSKIEKNHIYNQSYLFLLIYNWLIPMVCSILINLHDRSNRFSHFYDYFKKTSIQFVLYYIGFITLVLVIDPIEISCTATPLNLYKNQLTSNNLIPFNSIACYIDESLQYKISLVPLFQYLTASILIMTPYGFYTALLFKEKNHLLRLIILLLLPIVMELCNTFILGRYYDIERVFLGLLGGFLGTSIFFLLNGRYNDVKRADFLE